MNFFDMVGPGSTVVHTDEDLGLLVLWNGSCTFRFLHLMQDGDWEESEGFMVADAPESTWKAREACEKHFAAVDQAAE